MKRRKPLAASRAPQSRPKPTLEEIKLILHDRLPQLREEYGVGTLWLFGSYARGEQHKRSDLDVLVEFVDAPNLPEFISLERKLREITGLKVDLVSIRALKGEIGKLILQERVAL